MTNKGLRISLSRNLFDWALILLMCVCTTKWFYEGILAFAAFQVIAVFACFMLVLVKTNFRLRVKSWVWAFYAVSILSNMLLKGGTINMWGRAATVILTVGFAMVLNCSDFSVKRVTGFIAKIGIFQAIMVLVHFVLKQRFNALYFPLLNPINRKYAVEYYSNGYYFGLLDSPHEVAGLIVFAIGYMVFWCIARKRWKTRHIALIGMLLLGLLLTSKKAVLVMGLLAIGLTILVLFGSKKQWHIVIALVLTFALLAGVLVVLIMRFPNNPLFFRLSQMMMKLISGDSIMSTRGWLYQYALDEWNDNKLFGIGWRHFKQLTTTKYSFGFAHEVNCDYLQWLCEMGVVGLTLNMLSVGTSLYRTIYVCRKGLRRITDKNTMTCVLFAIFVQFFTVVYAVIEIPFYDIMFFAVYMYSFIIINSAYKKMKAKRIPAWI